MAKISETREYHLFGKLPFWKSHFEQEEILPNSATCAASDQPNPKPNPDAFPGTKGDIYAKELLRRILSEGCLDQYPSSTYADGTPAHTYSINHGMMTYDLTKGEMPLMTLRPIAIKSAIGELLWIYQDQSNDLNLLRDKYGITWWDEWDIGNRTIGAVYGETIRRHHLVDDLLRGIKQNPDGRRHIINMWQVDDFQDKHGLKPCAFQTIWNVRHGQDGTDYLDMCLFQRSSDFLAAGCINQMQYLVFLYLVARHTGYTPGRFTWMYDNIQIYDRHVDLAKELLERQPVACQPTIWLNPEKQNFYDFTIDDIKVKGYPRKEIAAKNPQMYFDLGHENVDTKGFDINQFKKKL